MILQTIVNIFQDEDGRMVRLSLKAKQKPIGVGQSHNNKDFENEFSQIFIPI